jgi:NDP-sugar pyrophosphorylase family protein
MHGLILAGGEGSRLANDGLTTPKPFVEIAGTPQLVRLVDQFAALGVTSITCMLRDDAFAWLGDHAVVKRRVEARATAVRCSTPSSLHTFVAGLAEIPAGNVFASMVDSVMLPNDWRLVYETAALELANGADAVLAVTTNDGGDDAPLWVEIEPGPPAANAQRVVTIGRHSGSPEALVTGGIYAFAPGARAAAQATLASGRHRMRNFLGGLVEGGARVTAVQVRCIFDIDHRRDLERANAYMMNAVENTPAGEPL